MFLSDKSIMRILIEDYDESVIELLHGWLLRTDIQGVNMFILEYEFGGTIILYFNNL